MLYPEGHNLTFSNPRVSSLYDLCNTFNTGAKTCIFLFSLFIFNSPFCNIHTHTRVRMYKKNLNIQSLRLSFFVVYFLCIFAALLLRTSILKLLNLIYCRKLKHFTTIQKPLDINILINFSSFFVSYQITLRLNCILTIL